MAYRQQDVNRIVRARDLHQLLRGVEGNEFAARTAEALAAQEAALRGAALAVFAEEEDDAAPRLARDAARDLLFARTSAVVRSLRADLGLQILEGALSPGEAANLRGLLDRVVAQDLRSRVLEPQRLLTVVEALWAALHPYPFAADRLRMVQDAAAQLRVAWDQVRVEKAELDAIFPAMVAARAELDRTLSGAVALLRAISILDPRYPQLADALAAPRAEPADPDALGELPDDADLVSGG
jgi:hypothetical protein